MRSALFIALACLLAGCGGGDDNPPPEDQQQPEKKTVWPPPDCQAHPELCLTQVNA